MITNRAKGATFVEAAIALPLILIAILTVIDVSRFGFQLAMFQMGAYRAGELASKIEGLNPNNQNAINEVRAEALEFAARSGIQENEMFLIPGSNPERRSPFVTFSGNIPNGVRIEIIAQYQPILPVFGEVFLRAQTVVLLQASGDGNQPMPSCWQGSTATVCQCPGSTNTSQFCNCPPPRVLGALGACVCPPSDCGDGVYNETTCECDCSGIDCSSLGPLAVPNRNCGCICPSNIWQTCWASFNNRGEKDPNSCRCRCAGWRLDQICRPLGRTSNTTTCECGGCLAGHNLVNDQCQCTNPQTIEQCRQQLGPCAVLDNNCTCRNPCSEPFVCNPDTRQCVCPNNHTNSICDNACRVRGTCACGGCKAPLVDRSGNCECPEDFCDGNAHLTVVTQNGCSGCRCTCPPGLVQVGNLDLCRSPNE